MRRGWFLTTQAKQSQGSAAALPIPATLPCLAAIWSLPAMFRVSCYSHAQPCLMTHRCT